RAASAPTVTTFVEGRRWSTTSAVITLVTLAIGRRLRGDFENSSCPVSRSSSTAEGARSAGGLVDGRGVTSAVGNGEGDPTGGTGVGGGMSASAGRTGGNNTRHRSAASASLINRIGRGFCLG